MSAVIAERDNSEGIQLAVPGLGERLKSARLAHDMEIGKLAARIHLTVDTVDALERDDYSDVPARVFVRGYVRNYARTVNLPVESILAQFDRQWPDEAAPVKISESPRLASDTNPGNSWPSLVTWLVVLVLLVLFLVWWQGYLDHFIEQWRAPATGLSQDKAPVVMKNDAGKTALPLAPLEQTAVESPSVQTGGGILSLPPATATAPAAAKPAAAEPEPVTTGQDAVEQSAVAEAASQLLPLPEKSDTVLPSDEAKAVVTESSKAVGSAAEMAPSVASTPVQPTPPVPERGITARFTQDCWVDIRDSTRTYKLVGTKRKGSEYRLGGKPPYKVILGNAHAAKLEVNGKPFDLKPYIDGNVARFTLKP